jgi:hypothetical protein
MPFTGTHPVAALPFLRTRLPASALVIGCLTPDLPYYLPPRLGPVILIDVPTHTLRAGPTLDLALGLAVWAIWHGLLSAPALHAAPRALRARLLGRVRTGLLVRLRRPRELPLVCLALLVGIATHLGWDAFTHPGMWGAVHVAVLRESWDGRAGYQWVQYASDTLGQLVLLGWLIRWFRRSRPEPAVTFVPSAPLAPWALICGAALLAGAGGLLSASARGDLREDVFRTATRGGAAGLVVAVILATVWQCQTRWRRTRPTSDSS